MPTPIIHTVAGACVAALAAKHLPAARALPVAAALVVAANLPDLDYGAIVAGRAAMERFHQGPFHSIGFVASATLPLAWPLAGRLGLARAWLLLAVAALTHLLLDLVVVDLKPPVGFAFLWPLTEERFHSSVTLFPGIDRTVLFGKRNLHELFAELAWSLPALPLLVRWLPRPPSVRARR